MVQTLEFLKGEIYISVEISNKIATFTNFDDSYFIAQADRAFQ